MVPDEIGRLIDEVNRRKHDFEIEIDSTILLPPPVLPFTHPIACKSRGGMVWRIQVVNSN